MLMKEIRIRVANIGIWVLSISISVVFAAQALAATKTVQVDATKKTVFTQVLVQAGDLLTIDASGQWSTDGKSSFGPDGNEGTADAAYQKPGAAIGCLLGRIGLKGADFVVGSHFSQKINETGTLLLGMNEKKGLLENRDNKGALSVNISITKTGESLDGDYAIEYLDDKMELIVGNEHTPIRFDDIVGKPLQTAEGKIVLSRAMLEKIKQLLPPLVHIKVDGLAIAFDDANKPNDRPAKGVYFPAKHGFILGSGGAGQLGASGEIKLLFITSASGIFNVSAGGVSLDGNITMSVLAGAQDKGTGLTILLPFKGRK